ncbi:DRTGG domain-containing protein [Natronincola peptidivorans]|uniref:DRTGG domain-containing protein n=1 Tax=Natronincola peptidivorans TaxID=426128 RepID=A0A1H9Z267_9FIRM|nr:DRTGG domain-containing protein [Natronincola peptidivorans]SES75450.1 DRTGG domain-containing protein [Natronincola peptidivorans]
MTLKEVQRLLEAEVVSGEEFLQREVKTAFACDLMSDVLAFVDDKTLLLTGLVNSHTIRTAEMMDLSAVVFVRGKKPDDETIELAKENNIVIMTTNHIMYVSSGILFSKGLKGANIVHK